MNTQAILDMFCGWARYELFDGDTYLEAKARKRLEQILTAQEGEICKWCGVQKVKGYSPSEYPDGIFEWVCDNPQCEGEE